MPPVKTKKRKVKYVPMIFGAGGWNANVLYTWATTGSVTATGKKPTVAVV